MPSLTCECYTSGCEDTLTFWHSHERLGYCPAKSRDCWALHAVQCAPILKPGRIIFSQKSLTDHLSDSGPAVHVLHEFPIPIPSFGACYQSYESQPCFRGLVLLSWDFIMAVKSDIKLQCVKLWLEEYTMEKLAANWNEPNTDAHADARAESLTPCWYGDRLGTRIPGK